MGRYSRMKEDSTTRSKSIDFSDLSSPLKAPKSICDHKPQPQESKIDQNENLPKLTNIGIHDPTQEGHGDSVGEVFGVILSRKFSVSSASSQNYFMCEKETASVPSAVKRVLFMKRSSSVAEGYSRIHHQCDPIENDEDDENVTLTAVKTRSIKKRGKIFRACKRIFGF